MLLDRTLTNVLVRCQILYRYREDGASAKKLPVVVEASRRADSDEDEENTNGQAVGMRRLLRKDTEGGMPDPVLSTLSVNKDLG